MKKVVKFGGSSLASAEQFKKVGNIIRAEESRRYVVCLVGSLTGAVASERVSEALKGSLRMVGNHLKSAKAEGSLTATPTGGAGTKVGLSDPVV